MPLLGTLTLALREAIAQAETIVLEEFLSVIRDEDNQGGVTESEFSQVAHHLLEKIIRETDFLVEAPDKLPELR